MSDEERAPMDFLDEFEMTCSPESLTDESTGNELPTALIVANIPQSVFENEEAQLGFESVFKELDEEVSFIYLRNFKRARIQFSTPDSAGIARIRCDGLEICGQNIKCFFSQVSTGNNTDNTFLQPPQPKRVFLISPPASPPVGWEPVPESEPIINYDLLNALAKLTPGETHEIHPRSISAPAIVVHLCEDPEGYQPGLRPTIIQTRRPDLSH